MDKIIVSREPDGESEKTTDLVYQLEKLAEQYEGEELATEVNKIVGAIEGKIEGAAKIHQKASQFEELLDARIKQLQELKRSYKSRQERLKNYMKFAMPLAKIKKVEGPTISVTYSEIEAGAVDILDEGNEELDEYRVKKETWSLDVESIKRDLKAGRVMASAKLSPVQKIIIKGE